MQCCTTKLLMCCTSATPVETLIRGGLPVANEQRTNLVEANPMLVKSNPGLLATNSKRLCQPELERGKNKKQRKKPTS